MEDAFGFPPEIMKKREISDNGSRGERELIDWHDDDITLSQISQSWTSGRHFKKYDASDPHYYYFITVI